MVAQPQPQPEPGAGDGGPVRHAPVPEFLVPALFGLFGLGLVVYARVAYVYMDPITGPGTGFFPTWLGIILVVLSALNLVAVLRSRPEPQDGQEGVPVDRVLRPRTLALFFAISAAAIALMATVGTVPALLFFVIAEMLLVEHHPVRRAVLTAIVLTLCVFVVFEVGLGVPLPGRLAELLDI